MRTMSMVLGLALLGCGGGGNLDVRIWGEDYIEEGIPAEDFSDGWSVTFDSFLVSVRSVSAAPVDAEPELQAEVNWIVDLAPASAGEGFSLLERRVPAGAYGDVAYRIGPAAVGAQSVNATNEDVLSLVSNGASLRVVGQAVKGALEKRFSWNFNTDTTWSRCASMAKVEGGGTAVTQLTIHGDHLFYDDLVDEEPNLAFQLIADADRNLDGDVTLEELKETELRLQERYRTGSTGITDLADYLRYQTTTLGHIDGEGHCAVTERG